MRKEEKIDELKQAYEAGKDKLKRGANDTNCHFSLFSNKAKLRAWEQGAANKPFNLESVLIASL